MSLTVQRGWARRPGARFTLLLLGLAAAGGTVALLGPPDRAAVTEFVARSGPAAPLAAVAGVALLTLAMVPRTMLALAGGLLFGTAAGGGYVLLGALIGASLGFAAGRRLGRDFVAGFSSAEAAGAESDKINPPGRAGSRPDRLRRRVGQLDAWLGQRGVLGVLTVRLIPAAPYGLMSYAFGTSATRFRHFLLGSALGAAPSSFAYAAVGAAVVSASPTALALGGLGLAALALVTVLGNSWVSRRRRQRAGFVKPWATGVSPLEDVGT